MACCLFFLLPVTLSDPYRVVTSNCVCLFCKGALLFGDEYFVTSQTVGLTVTRLRAI